jgi:hypothetical protein
MLGLVYACTHWRHYLHGRPFILRTDHESLTRWQDIIIKAPTQSSKRMARWAEELAEFDFTVEYIPGATNNVADALSRQHAETAAVGVAANVEVRGTSLASLRENPWFQGIIAVLEDKDKQQQHTQRNILRAKRFRILNNGLYLVDVDSEGKQRLRRCVTGQANRRALFDELHQSRAGGHQGAARTLTVLARHFFWRGMSKAVAAWTRACEGCQRNKPDMQRTGIQPPQPLDIPNAPGEHISVDFMELPMTTAGHNNIMVVVDKLTKLVRVSPCHTDISGARSWSAGR